MMGGGELIASFLDAGEIDECDIHVIPVFIGARGYHSWRRGIAMCRFAYAHPGSTRRASFDCAMKFRGSVWRQGTDEYRNPVEASPERPIGPSLPQAKRDVRLFLVLLFAFSAVFYALVLLAPAVRKRWLSYSGAFMWCPGLAALLTQLALHRNLRGLGWGLGRVRYYLLAYGLPLAFCLPVYLVVWLLGLGSFDRQALEAGRARMGLAPGLPGDTILVVLAVVLAPTGIVATLGEELGWRGLLVPRLAALTDLTKTSLITGLIWSLWHYPVHFAVLPVYLPRLPLWYATACFTVSVVAISFVYTWLRLRSGSVWPAALLHATSNAFQGGFETLTRHNDLTSYFTYEYGIGFAIVIPLLAIPFWRKLRRLEHDVPAG